MFLSYLGLGIDSKITHPLPDCPLLQGPRSAVFLPLPSALPSTCCPPVSWRYWSLPRPAGRRRTLGDLNAISWRPGACLGVSFPMWCWEPGPCICMSCPALGLPVPAACEETSGVVCVSWSDGWHVAVGGASLVGPGVSGPQGWQVSQLQKSYRGTCSVHWVHVSARERSPHQPGETEKGKVLWLRSPEQA